MFLVGLLKVNGGNSRIRIRIRIYSISQRHKSVDPDPDPHKNVMDPEHRFRYGVPTHLLEILEPTVVYPFIKEVAN